MSSFLIYFRDIRFWIALFFLMRLYGITNPPLEAAHSWRQTTVCMVARNFLEIEPNIFYPRIDIAGDKSGITGMEFPIYNYAIYLVSNVFGYQHWYGRLINLMVSSLGIYFFFSLVKRYFNPALALNASLILIVSLWFSYSRKIMPDTFAASLAIISLFYGLSYFYEKRRAVYLFLYFTFGLLALLSKVPVIFLFSIFLIPVFDKNQSLNSKFIFSLTSLFMLIPVFIWYLYWVPYLVEEFDFWHFFMGGSISDGIVAVVDNLGIALKHFYADSIKYIAFLFFIVGLALAIYKKQKRILMVFALLFFSFFIIILISGDTFIRHPYYMVPFVPIMALISAYGLSQVRSSRLIVLFLFMIIFEGIMNQKQDFRLTEIQKSVINLELDLNRFSKPDDLIVINSGENPTAMYFAHRKGWVYNNDYLLDGANLQELESKGCKYLVVLKKRFGTEMVVNRKLVFDNNNYQIYQLQSNR